MNAMNPFPSPPHLQGFTLVEMLVVIAVLLVLGGILIANFGGARPAAVRQNAIQHRERCETALAAQRDPVRRTYPAVSSCAGVGQPTPNGVREEFTLATDRRSFTLRLFVGDQEL